MCMLIFFLLVWTMLVLEHANPSFFLLSRQFRYANYSIDDKMKKGPILGVLLKQEYPPIIEGTTRDGCHFKYHASKWSHYSHTVRDDGQTPADRVKQEFWVRIKFCHCILFMLHKN